jgi:cellulose synthase/poly-beta-1,6-N-acetylglucosamine synthase-like glycosyltransferase
MISRLVAVEFEGIYGVSHPGRARMHGWGIFGGSNGYWRTTLLRETRMHGFMLTEDIDSSLRVVEQGGRIVSDPGLVSRELATTTLRQLWNQRMRWAQGWYQVSLKHIWRGVRSRELTGRQKLGFVHLLGWREVYPWLSAQILPIIVFWIVRGGTGSVSWFVPVFVLTTLFTMATGPGQTLFAYRLATPEVKKHTAWFLLYLVVASVLYTEFKNMIVRVAQVKEAMGERDWRVTPRSVTPPS